MGYVKRVREIVTVFFEEGFDIFVRNAHLSHHVPVSKRLSLVKKRNERPEVRLRKALERLGPTFIKLGQVLSLRPDVLPAEYVKELEKMQDAVTPMPFSQVKQVIREDLGKNVDEIFDKFERKPIASASLAQVHKARIGRQVVAVKVQRAGISKTMKDDIEILRHIAAWVDRRKVWGISLTPIIEEFKRWSLKELNFHFEASNIKLVHMNFKDSKSIIIPNVHESYSGEKVLTLDYVDGFPIHNLGRRKNAKALIKKTYEAMVQMVMVHGIFHADPHAGNILVCKNKIAFVDFGIVGRFDSKLRNVVLKLAESVYTNDVTLGVNALMDMQKHSLDKENLRRDLVDIFTQFQFDKLNDIKAGKLFGDILEVIYRNKLEVPIDFVLFAKTMITLEGLGLRYCPDLRLLAETAPMIKKIARRESSPTAIAKRVHEKIKAYQLLAEKSPGYILSGLEHFGEGKLGIEIAPKELVDLRIELEHSSGNVAIGMMVAAMAMSSALLVKVGEIGMLGLSKISFLGFLCSIALGIWLIKRTVFIRGDSIGH